VDVSDEAKLLVYIQYFDIKKGAIFDESLVCKQLPHKKKGEDIFKIPDNFIKLELDLQWEWCISVSTDGAASMAGQKSGLVARIREIKLKISWQHYIIHKQNLVAKKKNPDLHETLNISVKVVNLIKSRGLNSGLSRKYMRKWDSHTFNSCSTPRCDGYHEDAC
jgi:hypothetical protein